MKNTIIMIKKHYQIIMAALTILGVASCYTYGQVQKAQAAQARIEKTR